VLTGIEITARFPGRAMHVLAYGFEEREPDFASLLRIVVADREARNPRILARLAEAGCPLSMDEVAPKRGARWSRARTSPARWCARATSPTRSPRSRAYLRDGGPAFVASETVDPREVIGVVRRAGGVAVVAHPRQLRVDSPDGYRALFAELAAAGLGGIEVAHPSHSTVERAFFGEIGAFARARRERRQRLPRRGEARHPPRRRRRHDRDRLRHVGGAARPLRRVRAPLNGLSLARVLPRRAVSSAMGRLASIRLPPPFLVPVLAAYARASASTAASSRGRSAPIARSRTSSRASCERAHGPSTPDPSAVVSPIDGRVYASGGVDRGTVVQAKGVPYSVAALLGSEKDAAPLDGGTFLTGYSRRGTTTASTGRSTASSSASDTSRATSGRSTTRRSRASLASSRRTSAWRSSAAPRAAARSRSCPSAR